MIADVQDHTIEDVSLFAEDEWQMTDTFALTGGVRMNYHEVYKENVSPRLYGVWRPAESWTVKGGVSTGYKAPETRQIVEIYTDATGGGGCFYGPANRLRPGRRPCGVIRANTDLVPETSVNDELATLFDSYDGLRAGATAPTVPTAVPPAGRRTRTTRSSPIRTSTRRDCAASSSPRGSTRRRRSPSMPATPIRSSPGATTPISPPISARATR
ncbi:hypothetical protein ASG48_14975 [Aurantimonas sp. Leaf443]|nr:hypothetical protein ASG48_14975 [Aurantimonas sp. Leaf443]